MGGTPHVHVHVGWEAGRHGVGVVRACNVQARVPKEIGGRGTGGAYPEHEQKTLGGDDAGCVEAQRLVERIRALPSRKEGIQGRRRVGWEARARGPVAVRGMGGRGAEGRPEGAGHGRSVHKTCPAWW